MYVARVYILQKISALVAQGVMWGTGQVEERDSSPWPYYACMVHMCTYVHGTT